MGVYVEIMCDVRKPGCDPKSPLRSLCWSSENANPQGATIAQAKAEAKRQGWKLTGRRGAICPGCLEPKVSEAMKLTQAEKSARVKLYRAMAYMLHFVDKKSYKEIADQLGISEQYACQLAFYHKRITLSVESRRLAGLDLSQLT